MGYKSKEQQREYQRKWVAKRKAYWLLEKFCKNCGAIDNLEIDHIDPSLKITHTIWSWSASRREAELAKCQVLCEQCHQKRTSEQQTKPLVHGTSNAYGEKKCRCDKCKEYIKLYWRQYRAAKKAVNPD